MPAKFLVVLTQVRSPQPDRPRDERLCQEVILESIAIDEPTAAFALFTKLCQFGPVQQGRQRSKLIALSAPSTDACPSAWGAPLRPHMAEKPAGVR
jgi:hypothetical protein